jgi:hypothetical protein
MQNGVDSLTEERGDVETLASYVGVVWFGQSRKEKCFLSVWQTLKKAVLKWFG